MFILWKFTMFLNCHFWQKNFCHTETICNELSLHCHAVLATPVVADYESASLAAMDVSVSSYMLIVSL